MFVNVTNNTVSRYIDIDPLLANIEVPVVPADGIGGGDTMQIRYATNNPTRTQAQQHVRKPLIYVEGYDANNKYNIYSLISSDPIKPGEWVRLPFPPNNYDFMYYLDDIANYDLVFVNYNTLRSFEDNAKMLQQVIEWVNKDKAMGGSTAKNVVLGVSAGGVLSRYTLARMTKFVGVNSTDTRLLLTMDSPHQGANVPLALQHFLYDLSEQTVLGQKIKNTNAGLKKFINLNNKPATIQLLKARVVDGEGNVAFNTFLNGPESDYQKMVRFDAVNNPNNITAPYKFLAVSQGSQCGIPVAESGVNFASQDGEFALFELWLPSIIDPSFSLKSKWWLTTQLNALPNGGTANIEYFKFERRIKLWGIGFGWKTLNEYNRTNPQGFVGWDVAPGGTQSIFDRTNGDLSTGIQSQPFYKNWYGFPIAVLQAGVSVGINQDIFTFVSTTSALDAPIGTNQNAIFNFTTNGNANTSTFRYQAQTQEPGNSLFNRNHTDYTARNALWIYNELEDITQPVAICTDECPNNIGISGISRLCANTQQYSINGLPANASVAWSYTPNNGGLSITTSGNTASVSKVIDGQYVLTANVTKPCNSYSTSANIDGAALRPLVGQYTFPNYPNSPTKPFQTFTQIGFMGPNSKVKLNMFAGYTNFTFLPTFFSSNGLPVNYVISGSEVEITYQSAGQTIQGQYSYTNECGEPAGTNSFFIQIVNSARTVADDLVVHITPNPTTNYVTVAIENNTAVGNTQAANIASNTIMDLVDLNTNITLKQWKFAEVSTKTYTLDIVGIKKGIYSLRVNRAGVSTVQKLIIY